LNGASRRGRCCSRDAGCQIAWPEDRLSTRARWGPVLATDVLHFFPILECGLHRQEVCVLTILRVLLDGSACPGEAATACRANSVFCEHFRQRVRELLAKCRNVGVPVLMRYSDLRHVPNRMIRFARQASRDNDSLDDYTDKDRRYDAPVIASSSIGWFLKVLDGAIPLGRCRRPRAQPRLEIEGIRGRSWNARIIDIRKPRRRRHSRNRSKVATLVL
jgi:hypothetical protein